VRSERLVVALTLMAAACAEGPTAPHEPLLDAPAFEVVEASNEHVQLNYATDVPCANDGLGEVVLVSGLLHIRRKLSVDKNGSLRLTTHSNPHGVIGVGLTTGTIYHATGATNSSIRVAATSAEIVSVNNFMLIAHGASPNLRVHQKLHLTIDVFGEVHTLRDDLSVKCS
jgi:hypothetical protein